MLALVIKVYVTNKLCSFSCYHMLLSGTTHLIDEMIVDIFCLTWTVDPESEYSVFSINPLVCFSIW